jgi:hypothetical protein
MEDVTAGRVFKPDRRFYYKELFGAFMVWIFLWLCAIGVLVLGAWIGATDSGVSNWGSVFWIIFFDWLPTVNFWYLISSVFWFLPILIGIRPIDRLFGVGTVEIQTAGFSGGAQGGSQPEEKIEGVVFYEEVRDYILQELRKFRDPYVTTTEVVLPQSERVPQLPDSLDDEILITLREIRNVLEKIDKKFDEER